jgi:hypothetical protein
MPNSLQNNTEQNVALVDVLDRLLEKGAVVRGEVSIRLADVDLIYVNLGLLVTSISKIQQIKGVSSQKMTPLSLHDKLYIEKLEDQIQKIQKSIPKVIDSSDAEGLDKGLSRLVMTVVELLRRLIEREAVRQVKIKSISSTEKKKLGLALKALAVKMEAVKKTLGLDDEDLNLDLGPLGNLM